MLVWSDVSTSFVNPVVWGGVALKGDMIFPNGFIANLACVLDGRCDLFRARI